MGSGLGIDMVIKKKKKVDAKASTAPSFKGPSVQLGVLAERNMYDYGTYTIMSRAIPMLYDGMKPVYRRIIYSMQDMGMTNNTAHKKAARVVGDVMGKYHPHGDAAIYGSMVTLSTGDGVPFALIDGQGNWGNFDGSPAAAPRYTECRMTKYTTNVIVPRPYMDKEVIPYVDNYDGTEVEPMFLPSLLPTLFLIGAEGIATGVSVTMPAYTYDSVLAATKTLLKTSSGKAASKKLVPVQRWGAELLSDQKVLDDYHATGKGSLSWSAPYTVRRERSDIILSLTGLPPTSEIGWKALSESLLGVNGKTGKATGKGAYSVIDVSDENGMLIEVTVRDESLLAAIKKKLVRSQSCSSAVTILTDEIGKDDKPMVKFETWTPNQILEEWMKWRIELEKRLIKSMIRDNDADIRRLELMVHAAKHLDIIFEILKAKSGDKVAMIEKRLKVSNEDAKTIWQLAISRLDRLNVEDTQTKLKALRKDNANLKADYKKPVDRIAKAVNELPHYDAGTVLASAAPKKRKKKVAA